jgi:predicted nucleic acid-binding protein
MATLVVDASVVAKWYIPEQDHELARDLRDDYVNGTHDLSAPALLPFEVINALKYSGQYDQDQLREAASTLPEYGISRHSFSELGPVTAVSDEADIPIYDAAYVAIAESLDSKVYTADSRLLDALEETSYAENAAHIRTY